MSADDNRCAMQCCADPMRRAANILDSLAVSWSLSYIALAKIVGNSGEVDKLQKCEIMLR